MCFTPMEARVFIRFSGLSFIVGIIGSMRTAVGMAFSIRILAAFKRSVDGGAFGSISFAILSSSVVTVKDTIEGIFLRRSMSLVTRLDLVTIWILQFFVDRISRHFRIKPVSASRRG